MPHQHLDPVTKFHSLLRYKKTRRTFAKCSSASDSLRRNKRYSPIISSIHGLINGTTMLQLSSPNKIMPSSYKEKYILVSCLNKT